MVPTVEQFEHLGDNRFRMAVRWTVKEPLKIPEGEYWNFIQFLNAKHGTDADIAFRSTPFPEPPLREWKAGERYVAGPVTIAVPKHAGAGTYKVNTGFFDPKQRKSAGTIVNAERNGVIVGALHVEKQDGTVTDIRYVPAE